MRFHEVRTKSALNRVPAASRVPVQLDGQPVPGLLACVRLLRWRGTRRSCSPTARVAAVGGPAGRRPRSYGTRVEAGTGATSRTEVLDALVDASSRPIASRSRTARELLASGDHRFLTERGWKHVTGPSTGVRPAGRT